jgi:CheY-like chemotaxis protein
MMSGEYHSMCKSKIMILDDTKSIDGDSTYLTLMTILRNNGFEVDSLKDPTTALNRIASGIYDLVLLDLAMSYVNNYHLYQKIKNIDHKVKIYLLSSGVVHHDLIKSKLSPDPDKVHCYILRKPFENEQLMGLLSTILN